MLARTATIALVAIGIALSANAQQRSTEPPMEPGAKETMDVGNPHKSRLTREQQDKLDRAADRQQQQKTAEWSKLLGGEPAQVQPAPGGGVGNVHEQQAQQPSK